MALRVNPSPASTSRAAQLTRRRRRMAAHPLTGLPARLHCKYGNGMVVGAATSRLFRLSPRPTMGNVLILIAHSLPIPEAERGIALRLRGRERDWRGSTGRVRSVTPLFRT